MTHINQRRDTAANWTSVNPVLQLGEVGWETDTRKAKLGDGTSTWTALLYAVTPTDISGLATIASPTFTGDPKAPTPATGDNDTSIATTAFVKAQGYATLASPTLTGVPAAPTAAGGTNTTQIATTAFVAAAVTAGTGTITKASIGLGNVDNTSDVNKPVSTAQAAAIALKANIASPTLTGTPAAPTAAGGTNTTQIATTAYVVAAINSLVAGAPGLLDTLDEIAAALGDDPNFAATMTTQLALKAPLASPGLTGVPTAPTAAAGTSTMQIASTAFVAAAITAGGFLTTTAAAATYAPKASPTFTGSVKAPTVPSNYNTTDVATTAYVKSQGYVSAVSPALTGVPTAPTADPFTSTTQIATTEFVVEEVALRTLGAVRWADEVAPAPVGELVVGALNGSEDGYISGAGDFAGDSVTAHSMRLADVGSPEDPDDAVTLAYLNSYEPTTINGGTA